MNITKIKKRNGDIVDFKPEALMKWAKWAAIHGCDWFEIVTDAYRRCPDKCTTKELHQAMIQACIDKETIPHLMMAGRLLIGDVYKQAYGGHKKIPSVKEQFKKMVGLGLYEPMDYTDEELDSLETVVDHSLDKKIIYSALKQIADKYLIRDVINNRVLESPQHAWMRMALGVMQSMPKERRMNDVITEYKILSSGKNNVPTPFMVNMGTPKKSYASCFPAGTMVDTNKTQIDISKIRIGDVVVNRFGGLVKVKNLTSREYSGKLYSFDTPQTFNNSVFSTKDHLFWGKKSKNSEPEWLKAEDIKQNMWLSYSTQIDSNSVTYSLWDIIKDELEHEKWENINGIIGRVNTVRNVGLFSTRLKTCKNFTIDSEICRLFGYFLAEGHVNKNSAVVGFTLNHNDVEYINDIVTIIKKYTGIDATIHDDSAKDKCIRITVQNKPLWCLFKTLFGFGAANKGDLTGIIKTLDNEHLKQILIGYMRGDGCATNFGYTAVSVSKELILLIRHICARLNLLCSVRCAKPSRSSYKNAKPQYSIRLNINDNIELCNDIGKNVANINLDGEKQEHNQQSFYSDGVMYSKVREVSTKDYSGTVFDFEVDCNSHSFSVDNMIVHNCCVSSTKDTAASLAAANHIEYMMTVASAGQGSHIKTRSKGDGVRVNTIKHAGKLPYYRASQAMVQANLQGSRGGALTMHFNALDPEIETLLNLKNPTTVESKKINHIDYSFGYNPLFVKKAMKNDDWMLVSYSDSPELYEAFYSGVAGEFENLYNEYEKTDKPRTYVSARKIAKQFLKQAVETGRIYEHNTFWLNHHTPFNDKIYSSNLCQEIALPTSGYDNVSGLYDQNNDVGEIGLCSLGAICTGRVNSKDYEEVAYYTLLGIDNMIDIMDYPFPHLEKTAKARRSAGVGITNLAHDLAKRGFTYDSIMGKNYIHRLAEMHSFWLHKASVRLAKERGKCEWFHKTKYAEGWLPIDTYCKEVDNVHTQKLLCDWEGLRQEILQYGMRNSVLEAYMPVESSSVSGNTTNSLYPIRDKVVIKTNGTAKNIFIAPELDELEHQYQLAWDIKAKDLIDVYAIFQKFTGQAISADLYVTFETDERGNKQLSMRKIFEDWIYRNKMGMKTKYYYNSRAGVETKQPEQEKGCSGGGCTL